MKNLIDKYFKTKLDVPQEPPTSAWEFIQNHLPQKERKRFFPLWIQLSGIAALVLFTVGGIYTWMLSDLESDKGFHLDSNSSVVAIPNASSPEISDQNIPEIETANPETLNSEKYADLNRTVRTYQNSNKSFSNNYNTNNYNSNQNEYNSTFKSLNHSKNFLNENPYSDKTSENISFWNSEKTESVQEPMGNPFSNPLLNEMEKENQELITLNTKNLKKKKSKNEFKKKIDFDRFYISGFVSPMALNSFVGNSMLADEMGQYKTENNVTLSYGVKGAYAISPRVKIRTGVTVTGFEQITKNVPLAASVENSAYGRHANSNNINYNGRLRIESAAITSLNEAELGNATLEGNIQQQSQYIEIPLEAEVSLVKTNSIGISATGGGSTWLLSKNKIYAHTDDYTEELGKADNLNKTTFSANAGLKFDMQITDNVQINIEPNFKYLINPVNDIEKFNPYTVGVNAGVTVSLK